MKVRGGRDGSIRLVLDAAEAALMRELVGEMKILLEADIPPTDKVKQRLFPRAYETDDDERSYRDLTSNDLTASKLATLKNARDALGTSGKVDLDLGTDEVEGWLRLLTDLRLAIGIRLDVTEETMNADFDPDDPETAAYTVLHWLGWVQGSILERIGS